MIRVLFDTTIENYGLRMLIFLALLLALVFALSLHEFAHAYVALLNGDRTAKLNGRVTLNPIKHMDPIGFLMMMFLGFGFAKPVPVNPVNFKKQRLGWFLVSIAGVATNFVLAIFSGGILVLSLKFANPNSMIGIFLIGFLELFHWINLALCFFNLLPIFPLDGFNILSSILKPRNKFIKFMRQYGHYVLLFLFGLSLVVDYVALDVAWWWRLDILGQYIEYTAGYASKGIIFIWSKIFGV